MLEEVGDGEQVRRLGWRGGLVETAQQGGQQFAEEALLVQHLRVWRTNALGV